MKRITEILANDATSISVLSALASGCLWSLSVSSPPDALLPFYNNGAAFAAIASAVLAILGIILKPQRRECKDKSTEALALIIGRLLRASEVSNPRAYSEAKKELASIVEREWKNPAIRQIANLTLSATEAPKDLDRKPALPSQ